MLSVLALVKHPSLNYISCKMQLLISLQEHTCGIIFLQFLLRCFDLQNNTDVLKNQRFFICLYVCFKPLNGIALLAVTFLSSLDETKIIIIIDYCPKSAEPTHY